MWDRPEQRLDREKPHSRGHVHEVGDARGIASVLHGHALPDVRRPRQTWGKLGQAARPLRQYPEDMPPSLDHHLERAADKLLGHSLMEKVAHRVDEDTARFTPPQREREL